MLETWRTQATILPARTNVNVEVRQTESLGRLRADYMKIEMARQPFETTALNAGSTCAATLPTLSTL